MNNYKLWSIPLVFAASVAATDSAEARPNTSCPSGQTIQNTLSTGASWSMCWEARDQEGIVLSNVSYQAPGSASRRVLGEMSLSQIHRYYDDGGASDFLVTNQGLGGGNALNIKSGQCSGGQRYFSGGKAVLCGRQMDAGIIYKYSSNTAVTGKLFSLHTAAKIYGSTYTLNWLFHENGTIEPRVGLSGAIDRTGGDAAFGWPMQQSGTTGIGFTENYFWRLDFDLGNDPSNDVVEQISSALDTARTKRFKQVSVLGSETGRNLSPEVKRFWRVRDGSETSGGSPISYELVSLNYDHQSTGPNGENWLKSDVTMTRYNACERFAVANDTSTGCAWDLSSFANGQSINQSDVVLWNRISYHHLPRDEDDSVVSMRWNGFKLLPRDWHIRNPL